MFKNLLALSVVLALCLVNSCDGIKCYSCKSIIDPTCANDVIEPNQNVKQVDCDFTTKPNVMGSLLPVTKCNKVITKDRAGTIVSRDCHFEEVGQDSKTCKVSHSQNVESCTICTGDLCNSPAGRIVTMGTTVLFSIVAFAMTV